MTGVQFGGVGCSVEGMGVGREGTGWEEKVLQRMVLTGTSFAFTGEVATTRDRGAVVERQRIEEVEGSARGATREMSYRKWGR